MTRLKSQLTSLLVTVLLTALQSVAWASVDHDTEADIRWKSLTPLASLLLAESSTEEFIEQGDEERRVWGNYPGAMVYYRIAT